MHAYLIIAHEHFDLLKVLLSSLDDERNDIFIHINQLDDNVPFDKIKTFVSKSNLYFVPRIKIYRGTYSIMRATFSLIKAAINTREYDYFHLLSGQDLPLNNQDYIHGFFNSEGKNYYNFIDVTPDNLIKREWKERNCLHWVMVRHYIKTGFLGKLSRASNRILHFFERTFKIRRLKNDEIMNNISFGSSWFSITGSFAKYVVSKEKNIEKVFGQGFIPEESVFQTIISCSPFQNTLYCKKELNNDVPLNFRKIIWDGHVSPKTITSSDFNSLIESQCLFARKFDENVDELVIHRLYNYIFNNDKSN